MSQWPGMFDAHLEVAPPLSDEQLLQVPAKRGVLALLAADGKPILLLTAADIRARLRSRLAEVEEGQRKKTADLRGITRTITWKLSAGHFETDLNYFELARAIWPQTYAELLAWRKPVFVHVDPQEPYPHFSRSREVFARAGQYVGPFESAPSADKFIQALEDAFDLCRDLACLRQSPNGPPCSYLQMGRCLGPCCGKVSMEEYRQIVARAASFATGQRADFRAEMERQMKQAAGALAFERAGGLKTRLERLGEFDREPYRFVSPAEAFCYVIIGPRSRKVLSAFLVHGARVANWGGLDYPLQESQISALLAAAAGAQAQPATDDADRLRMGLVSQYLFCGGDKRGLILPIHAELTAESLTAAIESMAAPLGVAKPAKPQ